METWGKRRFPSWARSIFSGQHSIHINTEGNLMMFDNGVKTKKSRALSFTINEQQKGARVVINAPLPDELYSEKMGSQNGRINLPGSIHFWQSKTISR